MKKIFVIIVIVTVAGISIMGLQEHGNVTELTIARSPQPVFALLYIAEENGYFEDEGLDVSFRHFSSGRDALTNMLEGGSDLATPFETPVVIRAYEGEDISVITTLHQSSKNTGLVGLKSHGVNSVNDLVGKKIGVPKNTNAEFALFTFLTDSKIELSDVTILDIAPHNIEQALIHETVDAVVIWNPDLNKIINRFNEDQISVFYSDNYVDFSVLVGKRDFVIENKQTMIKIIKAIVKAEDFLQQNNQKAMEITAKKLPAQGPVILNIWDDIEFVAKLDNTILTIFEEEAKWFKNEGVFSTPVPDFRQVILSDYLKIVRPDSVSLRDISN